MEEKQVGYVYILTNPSFREDWVKIGKSSRPVDVRSKELDNTAVPLPFEIFATMKTVKYNEAEKLVHRYIERFTNLRIRNNREFFNVQPEEALEIFKEVAMLLDDAEICEVHKEGLKTEIVEPGKKKTSSRSDKEGKRVWLIPYNKKYFDLKGCYDKFKEVYWTQHFHFKAGDTGYIYGASPESTIRFRFEVKQADMAYKPFMDQDDEFVSGDAWKANATHQDAIYAHLILTGETSNRRLSLANLLERGLKGAPMGAMDISKPKMKELLEYIEDNF